MERATVKSTWFSQGKLWAFVPAALLTSLIGFQLWLARGALSDPSFAVEDGYYAKAISWDARMAQERENVRLGFRIDAELAAGARFVVLDKGGAPVTGAHGDVEAFAVARSSRIQHLPLTEEAPGVYRAPLVLHRSGEWELRVTLTRGADRFTTILRRAAPALGASR